MEELKKSDFNYFLPEELIAQYPLEKRDEARLLVYDRKTDKIEHKHFYDITDYLKAGDVLVINNTKVLPARIYGIKRGGGAKIELLLHKRLSLTEWEVLCRPGRRAQVGSVLDFGFGLTAEITADGEEGLKNVHFSYDGVFEDILSKIGEMPLPHYIHSKLTPSEQEMYQTVYAKTSGSSAAPTAGLHFTPELLQKVKDMGVEVLEVLLHVGLGTFRPVKTENILEHKMHSEYCRVDEQTANAINKAKSEGRRIIAVGTTSVRTLESAAEKEGVIKPFSGETNIFIYPSYKFKIVDALITNFHLPESTLIMLVSALMTREKTLEMYKCAVDSKYRFFSFGDACFII